MARLLRRTSLKAGIRQVQRAGTGAQCELAENQTCTKTLQAAERSMADSTSCTHVAQMAILRKPTIAQGFVPAFPVEQQTVQPLHRYPHIDIPCMSETTTPEASCPCAAAHALGKEHDAVINGTISSLKHELGNKSFHKLDTWVDLNYMAETSVPAPGTGPSRPRPVVNPSTEQAPAIDA